MIYIYIYVVHSSRQVSETKTNAWAAISRPSLTVAAATAADAAAAAAATTTAS